MPPIALAASLLFMLLGCGRPAEHSKEQHETGAAEILWTRTDLYEGKFITLASTNQRLKLSYHSEGVTVKDLNGNITRLDLAPPASILWRSNGDGVAINNGNGSGQMSSLVIVGDRASQIDGIEERLKSYFLEHTGCRHDPASVSVSAEGWSLDGTALWVRFESWDRKALCDGETVSFAQLDIGREEVTRHLSLAQAMDRFCPDPQFRDLYEPNCSRHNGELYAREKKSPR